MCLVKEKRMNLVQQLKLVTIIPLKVLYWPIVSFILYLFVRLVTN